MLLTKSFLPRKSQANYLEHPSQMKPRYFSNGTKMATAGLWRQYISPLVGLTPLLQLHGMGTPSFTSKDTQWVFPSLLSNDIQSTWGSMSPRRHSRTWQATFRANLSVIFSRRNTLKGSEYLPKAPSLPVLLAEQTTIRKALWGIHQQLLIYFLQSLTKGSRPLPASEYPNAPAL